MVYSAKEFAEEFNIDYPTARGFLGFLLKKGVIQEGKKEQNKTGRGRKTKLYDVPQTVMITLWGTTEESESDND